jgi:hypothetical protein
LDLLSLLQRLLALGALATLAAVGCQFPDYDLGEPDDSAGAGVGGSSVGAAGAGGAAPPDPLCDAGQLCATTIPEGWLGPVAFWQAKAGQQEAPPDCPTGYRDPRDLHRELQAPAPACTCTCAAEGQGCNNSAAVSIYSDLNCGNECAKPTALACSTVSGCNGNQGTIRAAKPTPSGGTCRASLTSEIEAATWQYEARICQLDSTDLLETACSDGSGLCAPTPGLPYPSQLCVVRVVAEGQALPACPDQYPNGGDALYTSFSDERGCSACACDGPSGGSCSGTLTLTDGQECSSKLEYVLGSGCKSFAFAAPPAHLGAKYALEEPGTCGVASDTQPIGEATPSGSATIVCCL